MKVTRWKALLEGDPERLRDFLFYAKARLDLATTDEDRSYWQSLIGDGQRRLQHVLAGESESWWTRPLTPREAGAVMLALYSWVTVLLLALILFLPAIPPR